MITDFFVNGMGLEFNTGLATYSAMTAPLYVIMLITLFYKSLADRFGRKLFPVLRDIFMKNDGGMMTADITAAMYFIPIVNATMTFISGFVTDALGRKRACIALSTVTGSEWD